MPTDKTHDFAQLKSLVRLHARAATLEGAELPALPDGSYTLEQFEELLEAQRTGRIEALIAARGHYCQDETATIVNGQWRCHCPGGGL